ncbi:bifunctional ADP-dependent NAD(P)H-hydrate dehydratase/NAD(P)H-hydrate epimerase [Arsenicicoccus dermatophilus]|uniref:bifunctional ADP-dependent NAD(P)H-hydrate dehydratase/NAD(P)H-hydrate epimerase n=1 Tax=Arsenicicoccus dermatophilus TaxID=1076331 RepID=UPI001F4D169B|nr:bifunctional ADP-dependent NAD(P)H-hydrate dehydratase/NAD(P)H-hydrate epimerase [Arsenicicoccus dermatophilus]MCH8612167.1 bifunctional ADP-dependent NAD(P)H-hydrate dehydratase/NAD(P)H-hydrate epimerase [Arsenicicoccus dermatophilus]
MIHAWSVDDVRAAEERAARGLPDDELMQRAAQGLAAVVAARLPADPHTQPLVVALVGGGNNGGDALHALAHLAALVGEPLDLVAVLTGPQAHEAGLAAAREVGVEVHDATTEPGRDAAVEILGLADVVLDGVYGIGGRAGLPDLVAALVDTIAEDAHVVAVDVPSGADPGGEVPTGEGVWADETVTFGGPKPVHVLGTADRCGLLTVVDIGLDLDEVTPAAQRLEHDDLALLWPVPGPQDDKYSRGVLGVVAGGESYTGAPALCVTAAVEAGAGMVRYVGPPGPTALVRQLVPEAVHGAGRVQAWVVGPGLDPAPESWDRLGLDQVAAARRALDGDLPCVVDAGALDLLDGPREHAGARTLLTPHAGELARLISRVDPDVTELTREQVSAEPVRWARRAAQLLRCTVLLKGGTTYVVPPPGSGLPVRAQADAPAWAGTAGSGDVLAGLAGALLAAGLDPLDAGSLAALVHGVAAHDANPGGPVRALAIAQQLPRTVARLLARPEARR